MVGFVGWLLGRGHGIREAGCSVFIQRSHLFDDRANSTLTFLFALAEISISQSAIEDEVAATSCHL